MKNRFFTLIIIFAGLTHIAVASSVPALDRYKSIYLKEVARLKLTSQAQKLHAPQEHIKAMRALEQEFQEKGDLKNLLAVRKERKRFISDPRVDAIIPVVTPAQLRALQKSYIKNYESIKESRNQEISQLKEKYLGALKKLQTNLTKQGKIDEALIVMNEIQSSKKDSDDSASGSSDFTPYAAVPTTSNLAKTLDIDTLSELIHGKVTRWSSYNNQITVRYDFIDDKQMQDWKGGKINESNHTLECDNTIAWCVLQMKSISKIECDMSFKKSDQNSGVVIGKSLTALITSGRPTIARVYQTTPSYPVLVVRDIENYAGNRYHSVITLDSKQVSWSINMGLPRRGIMHQPIAFPTFVGFGNMTSSSAYSNISITGILSDRQIERLKQQL